ncbi:hypothetical protein [Aquamicrobium zhengzhouense]|uniref:Uncharacterized protein n=1 Tax=Aquamicrobium zhengzhouense TaxID=2781738 RepID=A0ABS0SF69_9HYPH|nr:hypothetical protein [Aquamicrobium zhengzhouense]MBI1621083.1 hypothetical protein [Aquamicrobium zhengzhouense]
MPNEALSEDSVDILRGPTWEIYNARPDGGAGERVRTEYNAWKGNLDPGNYFVTVTVKAGERTEVTVP